MSVPKRCKMFLEPESDPNIPRSTQWRTYNQSGGAEQDGSESVQMEAGLGEPSEDDAMVDDSDARNSGEVAVKGER